MNSFWLPGLTRNPRSQKLSTTLLFLLSILSLVAIAISLGSIVSTVNEIAVKQQAVDYPLELPLMG